VVGRGCTPVRGGDVADEYRDTELKRQTTAFRDVLQREQHLAKPVARLALTTQRGVELRAGEQPAVDQKISEAFACDERTLSA